MKPWSGKSSRTPDGARIITFALRSYWDRAAPYGQRRITRQRIYELVRSGEHVEIVNTHTGEVITNKILLTWLTPHAIPTRLLETLIRTQPVGRSWKKDTRGRARVRVW